MEPQQHEPLHKQVKDNKNLKDTERQKHQGDCVASTVAVCSVTLAVPGSVRG